MTVLTIKDKDVEPVYDFILYRNIVGKDKDMQNSNFSEFVQSLCDDDPDVLIEFYRNVSGRALSEEAVAKQLADQGVFDDVPAACDEIIKGMLESGFLAAKVKAFLSSEEKSVKRMKIGLEVKSIDEESKMQIEMEMKLKEAVNKENSKRLSI